MDVSGTWNAAAEECKAEELDIGYSLECATSGHL